MYKQQQREALEKALESMNSENYKSFAYFLQMRYIIKISKK